MRMKSIRCIAGGTLLAFGALSGIDAQTLFQVQSETDGRGAFTYRFIGTGGTWAWGVPAGGLIMMQSHLVETATGPSGWLATVAPDGLVTWQCTNGTYVLEGEPLTFQIHSRATSVAVYPSPSPFFPRGISIGGGYSNHVLTAPGFHAFSFIGPSPSPRFLAVSPGDTQLRLSIEEMAGSTCFVQTTDSLIGGAWHDATNFPVMGYATNVALAFTTGATQAVFYRLRFVR